MRIGHLVGFLFLPALAAAQVEVSEGAPAPVQFGADQVRKALGSAAGSRHRVLIGIDEDKVKGPAESYSISVSGSAVAVTGKDAAGAMYGALDLAEQLRWGAEIKAGLHTPYLPIRGINTFLTAQGFDEPDSWYWSDEFWREFLDIMAWTRHNFLDLHGPFDITVAFPNGFPYFVWLPQFPDVGVGREKAERNLARFRQIIRMAADRGVKVGFMNYTAAATIGPWKTGRFWKDERYVPRPVPYLSPDKLEEYTRQAVAAFLKAVPELWMFGFRVGESGQPEDFYKNTYVAALKDASADLKVYARTWIADPKRVRELASLTGRRFYIEPKYNGEHLGLPYQAITGGRYYPPSGSWEDYSNMPRNFETIWQIRANGTHRVFNWGSPEFARRTARTCRFAGGVGFSIEPMNSYYPQDDYIHNNPGKKHDFYRWMFQKHWFWYMLWGRTGYDPDVSDRVWTSEFDQRFGTKAGSAVYDAVVESSKVVPFLYAYHNQGLDHQHMAPEFETGDHAMGSRDTIWQGSRLAPFGGGMPEFLKIGTMDRTAMLSPMEYARLRLSSGLSGKMTPIAAAQFLRTAADQSEQRIQAAAKLAPTSEKEFDCIRLDVEAVAAMGRYYADRIVSAAHLALYRETYHHPELTEAHRFLKSAADQWDRLSDVTDRHFGYVPELIRMRVYQFRWRDEGRFLGVALEDLDQMEEEFQKMSHRRLTLIGHVPSERAERGKPFSIVATQASAPYDARPSLFYRSSPESGYQRLPMKLLNQFERTWTVDLPAAALAGDRLEYYFESYEGPSGSYGSTLESRSPYVVRVSHAQTQAVLSHEPPKNARGSSLRLRLVAKGSDLPKTVRVFYKRMPAWHEWLSIEMKPLEGGVFESAVPLTPEGILYYFEAQSFGDAWNYPDFLREMPYFMIDPWDSGS